MNIFNRKHKQEIASMQEELLSLQRRVQQLEDRGCVVIDQRAESGELNWAGMPKRNRMGFSVKDVLLAVIDRMGFDLDYVPLQNEKPLLVTKDPAVRTSSASAQ